MNPTVVVNNMFAGLKANRFLRWVPGAEALVQKCQDYVSSNMAKLNLPPNATWQQIVDAVFAALEAAFPSEVLLLKMLQAVVDALFTVVPKAA